MPALASTVRPTSSCTRTPPTRSSTEPEPGSDPRPWPRQPSCRLFKPLWAEPCAGRIGSFGQNRGQTPDVAREDTSERSGCEPCDVHLARCIPGSRRGRRRTRAARARGRQHAVAGAVCRAARSLRLLVPRRRVPAGGARRARRRARLRRARAHRSRRRLWLARVRARREALRCPPDHRRRGDARRRRLAGAAHERRCRLCRRRSGDRRPSCDASVRDAAGLRQPLPHPHRCACRNPRAGQGARPPAGRDDDRDRRAPRGRARRALRLRPERPRRGRRESGRTARARLSRRVLHRAAATVRARRHEKKRAAR